jgi:hypothetical protein
MPVAQQILLDIIVPPVVAGLWWLMSRGWAGIVQAGTVSETTKTRQHKLFWVVLMVFYLLAFGTTAYYNL